MVYKNLELEDHISTLETDRDQAKAFDRDIATRCCSHEAEVGTFQKKSEALEATVRELRDQFDRNEALETKIRELQEQQTKNEALETTLHELQTQLKTLESHRDRAKAVEYQQGYEKHQYPGQRDQRQHASQRALLESDQYRDERHDLSRKLQNALSNIKQLEAQVRDYKTNICAATRPADETADDVIQAKFENLFRMIQGFVVRSFSQGTYGMLGLTSQGDTLTDLA